MVSEAEEPIRLGRRTELSRGPVITLVEREVDGKTFRVVEHPGASCAVPVTPDGKVVLIRQFRPAIGEWIWEIPAMMLPSRLGCPLSLKTANMGNPGSISRLFPTGTVIVTIAANIGETAIADYPVAFPDSLVGVTPHGINTIFLEYFLRTQKVRLNQFAPESAQKNINLEDLRPLSTPLPAVPEQQVIADLLDGLDRVIERGHEERDGLASLKTSAVDALLTSRVRVRKPWR